MLTISNRPTTEWCPKRKHSLRCFRSISEPLLSINFGHWAGSYHIFRFGYSVIGVCRMRNCWQFIWSDHPSHTILYYYFFCSGLFRSWSPNANLIRWRSAAWMKTKITNRPKIVFPFTTNYKFSFECENEMAGALRVEEEERKGAFLSPNRHNPFDVDNFVALADDQEAKQMHAFFALRYVD